MLVEITEAIFKELKNRYKNLKIIQQISESKAMTSIKILHGRDEAIVAIFIADGDATLFDSKQIKMEVFKFEEPEFPYNLYESIDDIIIK